MVLLRKNWGYLALLVSPSVAQSCRDPAAALIARALANYQPALAFCAAKYPVRPVTVTTTAAAQTVTTTLPAQTVTVTSTRNAESTTITSTATVTGQTVTITNTATITSTSAQPAKAKRQIPATSSPAAANAQRVAASPNTLVAVADTRASVLSSIASRATSLAGAVCTCLGKPKTITSTVAANSKITVTTTPAPSTFTSTADADLITITTTSTDSLTATETTTITVTTTVAPPLSPCQALGSSYTASNGEVFTVQCRTYNYPALGTVYTTPSGTSLEDCIQKCAADTRGCTATNWRAAQGKCELIVTRSTTTSPLTNVDFSDSALLQT